MSRESRAALGRQLLSFLLVGGVGLVVDIVVFNALRTTVLEPHFVHAGPVIAKVISTSLAIAVNWIGNRFWTFRAERRTGRRTAVAREGVEFAVVSGGGMLIALGCLWVSHYLLGYTSIIADNLATNVVGLLLGTAFRFALYRWWVFSARRRPAADAPALSSPSLSGVPAPSQRSRVPATSRLSVPSPLSRGPVPSSLPLRSSSDAQSLARRV